MSEATEQQLDEPAAPARAAGDLSRLVSGPAGAAAQLGRGFAMGSADLVPGVSGGTIALVLGIYTHLVGTIRDGAGAAATLLRGDLRGALHRLRRLDWLFLLPLLAGILLAVAALAGPLSYLLDEQPVLMSAGFSGLVIGSILVAVDELARLDRARVVVGVLTAAATFVLLGLRGSEVADPPLLVLVAAGGLAVCAMILPGVSGSFLLVTVGMYEPVLDAVHARELGDLAVFVVGAAVGLGAFSTGLNWLLSHYRDTVLVVLIGLLAGSLRVLWPWPTGDGGVSDTRLHGPVTGELLAAAGVAALGLAAVLVVARLGRLRDAPRGVHER